jgi:hypothetical protein
MGRSFKENGITVSVASHYESPQTVARAEWDATLGLAVSSRNRTPVDFHNLASRVIVPHFEGDRECVRCKRVPQRLKNTR